MIQFNKQPGQKILELGGGANRHPQTDVNVDVRKAPGVDFAADLNAPLPIQSNEFDAVYTAFCIEHVSWRNVRQFVAEMHRVLKPGGKIIVIGPNTRKQVEWLLDHPDGWDGKPFFESAAGLLYGDNDYPENTHRAYFDPAVALEIFSVAGFEGIMISPYGERETDLLVQATKPAAKPVDDPHPDRLPAAMAPGSLGMPNIEPTQFRSKERVEQMTPEQLYDKHYFNGGSKVGGYASDRWGSYRDFPVHNVTARHVLNRRPKSVLELGAARGYIGKRIEDAGVYYHGLEVSKHCYLTRVSNGVISTDFCKVPWSFDSTSSWAVYSSDLFDLCFSIATLEHVPEQHIPVVIKEMARICKRGLHGIDFGQHDDGFDKTHASLHPRDWWVAQFAMHAPGWEVEIVDKEELEIALSPPWSEEWLKGDGKVKLNIGSFTTMTHHGWTNIDIHDLGEYAAQNGYRFQKCDVRNGLPFPTGGVDLIVSCHMLEHLTYQEGHRFLMECRRVLKRGGAMRIIVPDAALLMARYHNYLCDITGNHSDFGTDTLSEFDEINDECAASPTAAGKLWSLLHAGHSAAYDAETLCDLLRRTGFAPVVSAFRKSSGDGFTQIQRETLDMLPCLSLYCDAVPVYA